MRARAPHLRVPVHGGEHEGGDAELGSGPGVDLRPVRQQQLDDVDVAAGGRQAQRGVVAHVAVLPVRAAGQEDLDHLGCGKKKKKGVIGLPNQCWHRLGRALALGGDTGGS